MGRSLLREGHVGECMVSIREAPESFDPGSFFARTHWHQRWELFRGVFLPGRNDVMTILEAVKLPADLSGCRVLDVGAWHGAFSFECERRGAGEIVALSLEDPDVTGFNRLKALLGSKVVYELGSVYSIDVARLGKFDVVLFLGVLYHRRYSLLGG